MTDLRTEPSVNISIADSKRRARLVTLKPYQFRAVEALASNVARVHARIAAAPEAERAAIARDLGTSLLTAPTGSGKTLVLGRTLETLVPEPVVPAAGFRGAVWFWFAPYSGLVAQTRRMLYADCPGLRVRDLTRDREPAITQDGDVFVQTWSSVAARNAEARRLRRSGERALSLDDMISDLREARFFVGCVIDEAHLNFGTTAQAAAQFYLDVLRPDATILATATPDDRKLSQFLGSAERQEARLNKVTVARVEVVDAGLNKRGLVAAHLALTEDQRAAIDPEETILRAAWAHHEKVKNRLAELDVAATPLLLVQVPDDKGAKSEEVGRVRNLLLDAGVPDEAIRVHTSGQPDPDFHDLANDEDAEVLVFKLAAATGFDAPRAFSLVSLRPVIKPEFGLQIVGRVMRVDPRVRANPAALNDPLLCRGTVFLGQGERQGGLEAAAETLKAFRTAVAAVTPQLTMVLGGAAPTATVANPDDGADDVVVPLPDNAASLSANGTDGDENSHSNSARFDAAFMSETERLPSDTSPMGRPSPPASALAEGVSGTLEGLSEEGSDEPSLFGELSGRSASSDNTRGKVAYPLRSDLGTPPTLMRERMPEPDRIDDLARTAAAEFEIDDRVMNLLIAPHQIDVVLRLRELLMGQQLERDDRMSAPPSATRIATAAQRAFDFNEDIDPRVFRGALIDRFATELRRKGSRVSDRASMGAVIDTIAVFQPSRIRSAVRRAMAREVEPAEGEPIPAEHWDVEGLHPAERNVYGVFPSGMNKPERRFAEWLDRTDGVRWWLRNPSAPRNRWAVRLMLASGHGFHPDFVIGVQGRRTLDDILLAEVKDDGEDGRLHADRNIEKIETRHRDYLAVLFVTEGEGGAFHRLSYNEVENRIVQTGRVALADLRRT